MPLYDFKCEKCEKITEVRMSLSEVKDKEFTCPVCSGKTNQHFSFNSNKAPSIVREIGGIESKCGEDWRTILDNISKKHKNNTMQRS